MSRLLKALTYLCLGLSVQYCGKDAVGTATSDVPPPNLPAFPAAEYDTSEAAVTTAEQALNAQGLKFTTQGARVDWDRKSILTVMAEHPDKGLEEKLPALESFEKALKPHVEKFGKGFFREEVGKKTWMRAEADPLRAQKSKLDVVTKTIQGIKSNSLLLGQNDGEAGSADTGGSSGLAAPPETPTNGTGGTGSNGPPGAPVPTPRP